MLVEFLLTFRPDSPAEDQTKGEHQVGNVTRRLGRVHGGHNGHGKGRSEPEEEDHVKPHDGTSHMDSVGVFRVSVVSNGVVPAEKVDGSDQNCT